MKANPIFLKAPSTTGQSLIEHLAQARKQIEAWFNQQWKHTLPPLYTSVDIRDSGFKLAPIDTNLFPAGFNNLSPEDHHQASIFAYKSIVSYVPNCQRILLIAENHTRNLYYLDNLVCLSNILKAAEFEVQYGTLTGTELHLTTASGSLVKLKPLTRNGQTIQIGNFVPDLILLNNDLSTGIDPILADLQQVILPAPTLGWHQRLKSQHFKEYDHICQAFSENFNLDPWLLNPLFNTCDAVDFMTRENESYLIAQADYLLKAIQIRYQTYHILQKPYIVIKADSGSYGMGVLPIETTEAIAKLSRKKRNHMTQTKGGRSIQKVILQEGVPTNLLWKQTAAEPVIYLLGSEVIGGFYRTHPRRTEQENLNTPGMQLVPLALSTIQHMETQALINDATASRFYAYGVIARLAALAAANEKKHLPRKEVTKSLL